MLIDTHAHLYWPDFQQDFGEVIERALIAGVGTIINIGVDPETSRKALRQAQGKLAEIPGLKVYSSIGIHPHEALRYTQGKHSLPIRSTQGKPNSDVSIQKDITAIEEIYQQNTSKVAMVGECGLDFLFDPEFIPPEFSLEQLKQTQIELFQAQIDLAKKLNLPLSIHCRDDRSQNPQNTEAWDKVINMTKNLTGIYHCYSGLPTTTQRIIEETNFLVSFAATLTYPKNDYLIEAIKMLPLKRIVLETDCPFLPPQSKRGTRNEPTTVLEIAQKIAEIKGITVEEVAEQTTQNALKLLPLSI